MKHRIVSRPFLFFILTQIAVITLLFVMSRNPGLYLPEPVFLLIILVTFSAYASSINEFIRYIKDLYVAEYAKELEAHCKSLLRSYQAFGAQQTAFQKQTHDVLNAQFTYHALIEQGKTEEAEQYRNQKQKEWRQES